MCCNNYFITIKRNWKIKKFSALIISPLCFINLQWGEACIGDGNYMVKTKLPINWNHWGQICLCTIAGTNDLKSTVVWDDKAIDKASGEVVFRCADYQQDSGGLWVAYFYIGS